MTRILVTGCAGFLGHRFCQWILAHVPDVQITGLDNCSWGFKEQIPGEVEFLPCNLGSGDKLVPWLMRRTTFDHVFHFAATACEGLSPWMRRRTYLDNVLGTAEIVNAILEHGIKGRLVFSSSVAVFGSGKPPFCESDACDPIDPYGVSKLASEMDIVTAVESHGLDAVILRLANVYGQGQSLWQRTRNVFGLWIRQALEDKPLTVFGDGSQQRAFTYIDDLLPAIWEVADNENASRKTFHIGSAHPVTILEAANIARELLDSPYPLEYLSPRYEASEAWMDCREAASTLGWEERTPLREGLQKMVLWAKRAWELYPQRRRASNLDVEVTRDLPECWRSLLPTPARVA